MTRVRRIGLIGAATITREWVLDAFRRQPGVEVVAVLGGDADRTQKFAADLSIPDWDTDIDKFLAKNELDAVYIASTNDKHCAQALAALDAGVHVLCEKPLAISLEEAESMVAAARAANLVLATNHHLRNQAAHRAIREIVQSGELGEIMLGRVSFTALLRPELARWRMNDPNSGAGVILDLTVHDIDTLRYWFAEDPIRVSGMGQARRGNGILDNVTTIWEFPSGAIVTCQDSFNVPHGGKTVELHGREASLLGTNVLLQQPVGEVAVTNGTGTRTIHLEQANAYDLTVADFLSAIDGEGEPTCSGLDGLMSLRFALAAQEAIATGGTIALF